MRDLEQEIANSDAICAKCAECNYAQNLYAALCNMRWQPIDIWPILKNELWSCSWRHAGAIVADIRNRIHTSGDGISHAEDYMDWYCSGMVPNSDELVTHDQDVASGEQLMSEASGPIDKYEGYVAEGTVTEEIRQDLASLGWAPVAWEDENE